VEWVEVTGKTVDEAKEAALDQLGVAESDAEVIVVAEPKTGLFGRVRGEARVRARVRPVGPRPKRTRRPKERERSGRNGSRDGRHHDGGEGQPAERPADDRSVEAPVASTGGSTSKSSSARRRRRRSGGARPASAEAGSAKATPSGSSDGRQGTRTGVRPEEEVSMAEGMTLQEQAEVAREFLEGLMEHLGFTATVSTKVIDDETVEVAATGDELGLLVGPRGSTLAALQDVTRTVVQRRFPSKTDRIMVDVAGYRERRAAALQRFSREVAGQVVASGAERALEPMSPPDRKVVHDTVNDIDGVVTRSEGEDPNRYIVIAPAG
jgi:spoIIIJ-associated protein